MLTLSMLMLLPNRPMLSLGMRAAPRSLETIQQWCVTVFFLHFFVVKNEFRC